MNVIDLAQNVALQRNCLCVGLDPDPSRLPKHLNSSLHDIGQFLNEIIAATAPYCVAYKVNFAFFEGLGRDGWSLLYDIRKSLPSSHYLIADAKRGDIGHTGTQYARSIFGDLDFDAVTLNPYMGRDVVDPFLSYGNKSVILLALTSNQSSPEIQLKMMADNRPLFEHILHVGQSWGTHEQIQFVIGATQSPYLKHIRSIAPNNWLLIPGVGAQGGNLAEVMTSTMNDQIGILINSSRGILYKDSSIQFAESSADEARSIADEMKRQINRRNSPILQD